MSSSKSSLALIGAFTLALGTTAAVVGVTDPEGAKNTLENTTKLDNIKTGGYSWFSCSKGDWFQTKFTGTNSKGKTVNGTVCKGFLKGSTIRYN